MADTSAHLIDEQEIGATYCGRMIAYRHASEPTPWPLQSGDGEAVWASDERHSYCADCYRVYDAA